MTEDFLLNEKNQSTITMEDDPEVKKRFLKNPFEEIHDNNFWSQVTDEFDGGKRIGWSAALNKVRLAHIKKRFADNQDPLVALLTDVFDKFKRCATADQNVAVMASFKQQLTTFVKMMLAEDRDKIYENHFEIVDISGNKSKQTILHIAADRDLLHVTQLYVETYSRGMMYVQSESDDPILNERLPLEFALRKTFDVTASYLASQMYHGRVRDLFESSDSANASFKFADLINNPKMTKTVVAILECCVNPDWPYTPVEDEQKKEEAWSRIPDTSLRYHFYYRLLDADQDSEPPSKEGKRNEDCNLKQTTCLQLLATSAHKEIAMYHPVVRKLVDNKWSKFGQNLIRFHFLTYVIFLIFLSCALLIENSYIEASVPKGVKVVRIICEIVTIIFTLVFLVIEIDEMEKERWQYWKDFFNYLDLLGLFFILLYVPMNYTLPATTSTRWIGAIAFWINCIRIFKYFPAFQTLGIYSKTFFEIIKYDISKFAVIFVIVLLAFGGSVFLLAGAVDNGKRLSLKEVMLREFRALAEGNPFNDSYDNFTDGVVFLIMLNMFVIIVILANILIGQLSWRYEKAMAEAATQFSIDKTMYICRLENNRFEFLNKRLAHYQEGDYVTGESDINEMLESWKTKKDEWDKAARGIPLQTK